MTYKVKVLYLDGYEDWNIVKTWNITLPKFNKNEVIKYLEQKDIVSIESEDMDETKGGDRIDKEYVTELKQQMVQFDDIIQWNGEENGYIFIKQFSVRVQYPH